MPPLALATRTRRPPGRSPAALALAVSLASACGENPRPGAVDAPPPALDTALDPLDGALPPDDAPDIDAAVSTDTDARPWEDAPRDLAVFDTPPWDSPGGCTDEDRDGISDALEGAPSTRTSLARDAPPDYLNIDSDDDTVPDQDEARRLYPGHVRAGLEPLSCGAPPDDCDGDRVPNQRDRDSDDDGLPDRDEAARWRTDPCLADTDGDGASDLVETVASSDPTSATSRPSAGTIYVTLPYLDPRGHQHREFSFRTRIRAADVMFLVDTTGSMSPTIEAVRASLASVIVPGIVSALGGSVSDVRYGLAEHRDFAEGGSPGDAALVVHQRLDPNPALAQSATGRLAASRGGDAPEAQVQALHALLSGYGIPAYLGTAWRQASASDCGGDPTAYGWACFQPGRVPVLVLFSDAPWHNGPGEPGNFYLSAPGAATYPQLVAELNRREAFFLGIDVGIGETYAASRLLAAATRTVDASGAPVAFAGSPSTVATDVVRAITAVASGTRQDVTRRVDPDPAERRLSPGRTTASFLQAVSPLRASPPAPLGYTRHDRTTFYNVAPSTEVLFDADCYNDFHRNTSGLAQLFRATIAVLGRASSVLDTHPVFVIVPADPDTQPL